MNGAASGNVRPSTVTCCSSMHSSSADWVLGEERFTSSARTKLAKTGPARNSNVRSCMLNTLAPVTSDGSKSGVNWMRRMLASRDAARVLASIVLPTPGTSSISRCPWLSSVSIAIPIACGLPEMTDETSRCTADVRLANCSGLMPAGEVCGCVGAGMSALVASVDVPGCMTKSLPQSDNPTFAPTECLPLRRWLDSADCDGR